MRKTQSEFIFEPHEEAAAAAAPSRMFCVFVVYASEGFLGVDRSTTVSFAKAGSVQTLSLFILKTKQLWSRNHQPKPGRDRT